MTPSVRRCVRWLGPMLAAALAVTAAVAGAAEKTHQEVMTRHLAGLEKNLATERDPDARRQLLEEIEWTRHGLGPVDSTGRRVQCRAMWHDVALRDVEDQIQKMERSAAAHRPGDPAAEVRLALRRLAREALWKAWAFSGRGPDKFQFDAVGTYVYNNVALLDDLAGRAAKHLADAGVTVDLAAAAVPPSPPPPTPKIKPKDMPKVEAPATPAATPAAEEGSEGGPAPPGYFADPKPPAATDVPAPGAETPATDAPGSVEAPAGEAPAPVDPRQQAVALLGDGLVQIVRSVAMIQAADAWGKEARDKRMAALDDFGVALADVHVATAALDAAGPDGAVTLPEEKAPGLTARDKALLAETNDLVAGIPAGPWDAVRAHLERFAAIAEQGLKHPLARREAGWLLAMTHRAAMYVRGLVASKSALAENVAERRQELIEALDAVAKAPAGQRDYSQVSALCPHEPRRQALDSSVLSPEACQGLMRLLNVSRSIFEQGDKGQYQHERFTQNLDVLITALGSSGQPAPAGMDQQFRSLYDQCRRELHQRAEAMGAQPPATGAALGLAAYQALIFADDMARLVRADEIVGAARTLMPREYQPLYKEVLRRAEKFILDPSSERRDLRMAFDQFLEPLDALTDLRMPEKQHTPLAMRLSGGAYRSAAAVFGEKLSRNMLSLGQGNSDWLGSTLDAAPMFNVLRHRAVADEKALAAVAPSCLEPFSFPPKPWSAFVSALDERLAGLLRQYGAQRAWDRGPAMALGNWDRVYATVVAAQYRTREAAKAGQTDLDWLVGRLAQAARPEPSSQRWVTWACGYHTLEAAVSLVAGQPQTAREHLGRAGSIASNYGIRPDLGWKTFDPPALASLSADGP